MILCIRTNTSPRCAPPWFSNTVPTSSVKNNQTQLYGGFSWAWQRPSASNQQYDSDQQQRKYDSEGMSLEQPATGQRMSNYKNIYPNKRDDECHLKPFQTAITVCSSSWNLQKLRWFSTKCIHRLIFKQVANHSTSTLTTIPSFYQVVVVFKRLRVKMLAKKQTKQIKNTAN